MPRRSARTARLPLVLFMVAVVGLLPAALPTGAAPDPPEGAAPDAASMAPRYFEGTKHYLSGRFRQYWKANGDLYVFGLPLTRVYDEASTDGKVYKTQYFERARFEYHPENQPPYDVLLTLLGNEIAADRLAEPAFQSAPRAEYGPDEACQVYSEPEGAPKHNLRGPFCEFWQRYGGLQNFGFPLSEEFRETNSVDDEVYLVQYFERGRWEYHPENETGSGFEVLLGFLGRERMDRLKVPEAVRAPETAPPTGADIPGGSPAPPVAAPPSGGPMRVNPVEYGFNVFLRADAATGDYNDRAVGKVREAGFGWVRLQLVWRDLEPARGQYDWAPLDKRVAAAHGAGLKVLFSVVKSPNWATPAAIAQGRPAGGLPEDPAVFGETMRAVAARYQGRVQAYEIWNEQNMSGEVGGYVEVAPYLATLKAAYTTIKGVDRGAFVLVGGMTPATFIEPKEAIDETEFLRQIYTLNGGEGRNYFDAVATLAAGTTNPPEARWPENPRPGHCTPEYAAQEGTCWNGGMDFYFRRPEDLRAVMEQYNDGDKQIWITEFGWASCQGTSPFFGYEYCLLNTEQVQADYTVRAIRYARERWPWAGVLFVWNLNYSTIAGTHGDEKASWSVVRADWSNRPVYEALKGMEK